MIGYAAGQHGRAQDVGRAGHRRAVGAEKIDGCAGQSPGGGHDVAVFQPQVGARAARPFQVQIDRAVADVASAGQRDNGLAAPGQQRTEHAEAGPHLPHAAVPAHRTGVRIDRFQLQCRRRPARLCMSEAAEHAGQCVDIGQSRHVLQPHRLGGEDGRRHDRQRGVLRAATADFAVQCERRR